MPGCQDIQTPSLRPQLLCREEDQLGDTSTLADPSVVADSAKDARSVRAMSWWAFTA